MTTIVLRPSWVTEDGLEPVLPSARYFIRPTNTYAGSSGGVLNIFGPPILITGGPVTINLDASSGGPGPYEFQLRFRDGEGKEVVRSQFSTVPDTGSFNLESLPDLGPTLGTSAPFSSADHDALVALQAQVNAMNGGATNLAGITDMSAFSRVANKAVDAAAWRAALVVGTSSLAIGTTTGTAADGGTVTALGSTVAGHTTTLSTHTTNIANNTTAINTKADSSTVAAKIDSSTKGVAGGVAEYDSSGYVLDAAGTKVAGVGNAVMIFGAATARVHPTGGYALPTGTCVIWVAASSPSNMTNADIWINDPNA